MPYEFTSLVSHLKVSRSPTDGRTHDAFLQIQQSFNELFKRLGALEDFRDALLEQFIKSSVFIEYYFLTEDLELPNPSYAPPAIIFYTFVQDSTGGWVVTLPDSFVGFMADHIDTTADTLSTLVAFKRLPDQVLPAAFGPGGTLITP